MTPHASNVATFAEEIRSHGRLFQLGGIAALVLGVLAVLMPLIASLAVELVVGAILAAAGLAECVLAFRRRRERPAAGRYLAGLLALAAGALLLVFPLHGMVALTIVLAAFFLASGALRGWYAWQVRPAQGWGWIAASGGLSVVLGLLVAFALPGAALWVPGLLLGIDLLFYGVALLAIVRAARQVTDRDDGPTHAQPQAS
jgi:uncharacterized membrane protein HdeD (DUF308 family)